MVDLLGRVSLPAAWSDTWKADPTLPVIRDVDGTWLDGFDMLDRTARVAARLHAAGLRPGERVIVSGEASADLVIAHCGALRVGLVVVPIDGACSRRELDALADAHPKAAIVEDDEMRSWLPADLITTGVDV
ncbi:MAG: malonyl-CoA/methylmalonyl-CoA synthetase, partial [Actinomycetota bacterium]|nr:malonyl-CoA/methylmalonyl-CoA synthetase [Actinomycetota bacterium]